MTTISKNKFTAVFKKGIFLGCMTAMLSSCVTYIGVGPHRSTGWTPGYWEHGYWVPAHHTRYYMGPSYYPGGAMWMPGYWNRYGQWVPGHWRY